MFRSSKKRWNRFRLPGRHILAGRRNLCEDQRQVTYLYRAVDKQGKTVDFLLRAKRDVAAAKAFFRRAFKSQGRLPQKITLDGYQASHRAAREILDEHQRGKRTKIRSSKYLNNLIEQDHRSTKFRLGPMFGMNVRTGGIEERTPARFVQEGQVDTAYLSALAALAVQRSAG